MHHPTRVSAQDDLRAARGHATRSTDPLITVIIPCHNQGRYLAEAIDSVLTQGYSRTQIVIVDDASTDRTAEVARSYPSVQYVRQPHGGRSQTRNVGLRRARGEFVVFLDADDRLLPGHFAISLRTLAEAPDAAFVFGDFRALGGPTTHRHRCAPSPDYYATFLRKRTEALGALHAAMFRRVHILAVGGFQTRFDVCEDIDLFLRLARHYPVVCHHQVIAEYRRHSEQITRRYDLMLAGITRVYRRQWLHAWLHPAYRAAYRDGCRLIHQATAVPLAWMCLAMLKARNWSTAGRYAAVLLRYAPAALLSVAWTRLRIACSRGRRVAVQPER